MSSDRTCKESIDLLMDYLDGLLPNEDRSALDRHFAKCAPCLEFVRSYQATPAIMRRATCAEMPDDVKQRLDLFLREKKLRGA